MASSTQSPKVHHLRRITVYVDEARSGQFSWVLHESAGNPSVWNDIASSQVSYKTWVEAFDEGVVELNRFVLDERRGPRAASEDEDADPVG